MMFGKNPAQTKRGKGSENSVGAELVCGKVKAPKSF